MKTPVSKPYNPRHHLQNEPPQKKRKPRSRFNKHGGQNFNLCDGCGYAHCDPIHGMGNHGFAMTKIQKRLHEGKCMGCGKEKNKCSCKSKM